MSDSSIIILSPASQVFVDSRTTSLGPWTSEKGLGLNRYYTYLVVLVTFLSVLKTLQAIAVVWVQNVVQYSNPDVASTLVDVAWWQVSVALMTGIVGSVVQSFFALRYYKLSRNWVVTIMIFLAIFLGLAGVSLSMHNIIIGNTKGKVMWLLVHFVSVFIADLLITGATSFTLRRRSTGLASTSSLVNRLPRLIFESAIPPTIIATIDLNLTQTLGSKLLWPLFVNYSLSKVYVISLLYTLNCIGEYRTETSHGRSNDGYGNRVTKSGDIELAPRVNGNILVQTQVITHIPHLRNDRGESGSNHSNSYPGHDKFFAL
ncbi:hypothetical protein B0H11DRAFT_2215851 [Mycena galericulata]|nr:hypothetical protein B0H11DRAFT_2215851 [Mycena galericulata]